VTVLKQVVPRLVSPTVILRVAPLVVIVRSVVGALHVHTREGMPRLELVVPRSRPLLRPGWGRVRLALLPEHIPLVEVSPLAPRPSLRPLLLRCPASKVRRCRRQGMLQPLDTVAVRFAGRLLCLSVRYLISGDPLVRGAPSHLDLDSRLLLAQGCYRLPRLKSAGPTGAGLVVRHPL